MASAEEHQVASTRTQSLFREVNERIESVTASFRADDGEVLCECVNPECAQPIHLTLDEYEAVRSVPTRFVVAPGHDVPDVERVVEETDRYVVVEKFGRGGAAATRLDPRRRSPGPWAGPTRSAG